MSMSDGLHPSNREATIIRPRIDAAGATACTEHGAVRHRLPSRTPPTRVGSGRDTVAMQKLSIEALARQQMKLAATAGGRHTADTVYGGHEKVLRQTVIGMIAGARLAEHENPGEATVLILHGRVRLAAAGMSWDAARGDLLIMPNHRHSLEALEDSAVLPTVAKLPGLATRKAMREERSSRQSWDRNAHRPAATGR